MRLMLNALVVSLDPTLISTIQSACAKLGISSKMCTGLKAVPALLARNKIYAVVLDEFDPETATQVLTAFRQSPSSRFAVTIAAHGTAQAGAPGVTFLMPKPVSEELAFRTLRLAQGQMMSEFLRYARHPLRSLVAITNDAGQEFQAMGRDVSQRGLGIKFADSHVMSVAARLDARLVLSGMGVSVETRGQVAWCDRAGRIGICCQGKTGRDRQLLEQWLEKQAGHRV